MVTFLELASFSQCLEFIFILLKYSNIQCDTILLFIRSLKPFPAIFLRHPWNVFTSSHDCNTFDISIYELCGVKSCEHQKP